MNNLPGYVGLLFMLTTFLTVFIFYRAAGSSKIVLGILISWLVVQTFVSLSDFYLSTNSIPPRFSLTIVPPVVFIILLFSTTSGRRWLDSLNLKALTMLHIVRIPVELTLFLLFVNRGIPELMTFEGRNFDILSGITAPVVYCLAFSRRRVNKTLLLAWNFICLGLLLNIVGIAILSAPFPFQQFAFDQPNVAVLYFPFVWLPCCIVPLVLLSHLVSIRQILKPIKKAASLKPVTEMELAKTT